MVISQAPAEIPLFEKHMQTFLARRDTDLDSQATVFNLDHAALDVISTLETLVLRPRDLTRAGFVLLMSLWITGPRETRELSAILRVTKGAVVGAVNTLERRGLVRRVKSEADRRLVTVVLTDEGSDLITSVQAGWRDLEVEVTADLTTDEKRTLAALCRKLAITARAIRRERVPGSPELPDPSAFLPENTKSPKQAAINGGRR